MKLELKHIVGYLPYGVKAKYTDTFRDEVVGHIDGFEKYRGFCIDGCFDKSMQPILRPLSDLTKEIEHNGERFVPEFIFDDQNSNVNSEIYLTDFESRMYFEDFIKNHRDHHLPFMPYGMIEKLYEWHFDIHGLIDKGLAISIHETN